MKEYLCGSGMINAALTTLIATVLSSSIVVAEGATPAHDLLLACSDAWHSKPSSEIPPGPDDTIDPRSGKPLSQTPGAKRSRAAKLQAFKDAATLECIKHQADLCR
jgi:hypothetical protein